MLPGPPVLTPAARQDYEVARAASLGDGSPVVYGGPPRVDFVLPPLQVFGLKYALDVVLVSTHPDWVMHEYARIDLPDGPLWVAKDAGRDREQTITANLADIDRWVPEVPVHRREGPLFVDDRSSPGKLDISFDYLNPLGQRVQVDYAGPLPTRPSKPRNGNTMGHSRQTVAALLDLFAFRIGGRAHVSIDGEPQRFHRLLGILPEVYLLGQVQGGFAATDFRITKGDQHGFVVVRPGSSARWPTQDERLWESTPDGWSSEVDWTVTGSRYHFVDGELDRAQVFQAGEPAPIVDIVFSPRLPDVRRRFTGTAVSRFVADINGQAAHGVGHARVRWLGDELLLDLAPLAPDWFADRPMRGLVHYADDEVTVSLFRVDTAPKPFSGHPPASNRLEPALPE